MQARLSELEAQQAGMQAHKEAAATALMQAQDAVRRAQAQEAEAKVICVSSWLVLADYMPAGMFVCVYCVRAECGLHMQDVFAHCMPPPNRMEVSARSFPCADEGA